MSTGDGISSIWPAAFNLPSFGSTEKTTRLFDFWLAATQVLARWVEGKIPGDISLRWHYLNLGQRALGRIDSKNRNAVIAAIGGIQKSAGPIHLYFCRVVYAGETVWQVRNSLHRCQRSLHRVVGKDNDARTHFAHRVSKLAPRPKVKCRGPRPAFTVANAGSLGVNVPLAASTR